MARTDTFRLLKVARQQLVEMGVEVGQGRFVCHLCLRTLSTKKATTGHFPSRAAGGGHHSLQCDDCNNRLGSEIERDAARFLSSNEWEMTVGPPGSAGVRMSVTLDASGPSLNLRYKSASNKWGLIRYLAQRSSRPDVFAATMTRPHPDALRMAILAWSYSEWSNYAGYVYTASAGAEVVRRALLDGSVDIPESAVVFFRDDLVPPLRDPAPVLVVHAENDVQYLKDVEEFVGVGVGWSDSLVGILPAAGDTEGRIYTRLVELHREGKRIRYLSLRKVLSQLGVDSLSKVIVVSNESGDWQLPITDDIDDDARQAWVRDAFPRRLEPSGGQRRQYPPGLSRRHYMVEDALDPRVNRTPPNPPRSKRPDRSERRQLSGYLAVRRKAGEEWHLATHLWMVGEKPTRFVVFCGEAIPWDEAAQRQASEVGRLGVGFACHECTEIMSIKPAAHRIDQSTGLP